MQGVCVCACTRSVDKHVGRIHSAVREDGSATIRLHTNILFPCMFVDRLRDFFDGLDRDGSGKVDRDELIQALRMDRSVAQFFNLNDIARS